MNEENLKENIFTIHIECPKNFQIRPTLHIENTVNKCIQIINQKLNITYEGTIEQILKLISSLECEQNYELNKLKTTAIIHTTTILQLPDDCLLKIFDYIKFSDQLVLSRCHERFNTILSMNIKRSRTLTTEIMDPRLINLYEFILEEYNDLIDTCQITYKDKIYDWDTGEKTLEYCLYNFDQLKCLKLDFPFNNSSSSSSIYELLNINLDNLLNLNKLIIKNNILTDKDLNLLSKLNGLKYLDISNNTRICGGKYIKNFKNLNVLILYGCTKFQSFLHISKYCQKLKILDIRIDTTKIQNLTDIEFLNMFMNLTKLECLGISQQCLANRNNIDEIFKLTMKNLKYLIYVCANNYQQYTNTTSINQFKFLQLIVKQLIGFKIEYRYFESITYDFNYYLQQMINLKEFHIGGSGFDYCYYEWSKSQLKLPLNCDILKMSVYTEEFCYQSIDRRTIEFHKYITTLNRYDNLKEIHLKCLVFEEKFLFDIFDAINYVKNQFKHKIIFNCSLRDIDIKHLEMNPKFIANKDLINFVAIDFDCTYEKDCVPIDELWNFL